MSSLIGWGHTQNDPGVQGTGLPQYLTDDYRQVSNISRTLVGN